MSEPMIDLTLSLDELTEQYGPDDGQTARCICKDRRHGDCQMVWMLGERQEPVMVRADGGSFYCNGSIGPRFVRKQPIAPPGTWWSVQRQGSTGCWGELYGCFGTLDEAVVNAKCLATPVRLVRCTPEDL